MGTHSARLGLTAAAACAVLLSAAAPAGAQTPSLRSQLYSAAAVARFCSEAQKVVSSTALQSINITHLARTRPGPRGTIQSDIPSFTASSAAPYIGPNLSAYNGKETPGDNLPLTTQQMVTYRLVPYSDYEVPVVISCKMKSSEGIQYHFGPAAAGPQSTCKAMNQQIVAKVFDSLTAYERRYLRYDENQIVYLDDSNEPSGPTWLGNIPVLIPTVLSVEDGLLYLFGKSINVPVFFDDPNVGNDKKGSYYCHFPAPEYLRAVITGQLEPFPPG